MLILSLLICIGLAVAAFSYPPAMACLFMIGAASDTIGIGGVIRATPINYALGPFCFISALLCYGKLWRERRQSPVNRRIYYLATLALAGSCWIGLSAYLGTDGNLREVYFALFGSGMFGIVIALAYRNARPARLLFAGTIIFQLLLSACITLLHTGFLRALEGTNYISAGNDLEMLSDNVLSAGDIMRVSAQFANPVQLGFYAVIGLIVGGQLLLQRRWVPRLAGAALLGLAGWAVLHTVERAMLLGLGVALVVLFLRAPWPAYRKMAWVGGGTALLVLAGTGLYLLPANLIVLPPFVQTVIGFFGQLGSPTEYAYRLDALSRAINLLTTHPLFGVGTFENLLAEIGMLPHQVMVSLSVVSGIPVGLCCTLLLWYGLAGSFASRARLHRIWSARHTGISLMFGWVVFSMAVSNNMSAGMFTWICLAIAMLPWAETAPAPAPVLVRTLVPRQVPVG